MKPATKLPFHNHITKEEYYTRRYKRARSVADQWISLHEACSHYAVPGRNLFYWTQQTQGAQKNSKVYDTTLIAATRKFVSKVLNAITPPQMVWAKLKAGESIDEEFKEHLNVELQKRTDIIFNFLHKSNFDLANHESLYDAAIGTGNLICNEGPDDDPLRWSAPSLARVAIEESASGIIESQYRWWDQIRIDEIMALWPNAKLTNEMEMLYKQDPNANVKMLIEGCIEVGKDMGSKGKFVYIVMHENQLLIEEWCDSSPWITYRWSKNSNEAWGRGPVMEALPSMLSANEIARLELVTANFNAAKPWMGASDGVFNPWTFVLSPNTMIPVAPNSNGQFPIIPFPDNSPPQFVQLTLLDLRNQINILMYADPLGPVDGPTKTATELALRQRNLAEEIGPPFTRLQKEYLSKIISRVIYILQKKGFLEPIVINGREIQLQYQSPLVVAQGQQDVANFTQWYQLLQGIYGPEAAITYLNPVEQPYWMANKMGVDMTILNDKKSMEEMLKEQSELAQEKEMMLMQQQGDMNGQQQPALAA